MFNKFKTYIQSKKAEHLFLFSLKMASIFLLFMLVTYHLKLIIHPFPIEIREGGDLLTIKALSDKINPYALSNQPVYDNPYGIVYPLLAQQVAVFFGVTLFSARLLSALAIYFSLILIFIALRKEKINFWHCLFGMTIFYTNILFWVTPICRPDSLGMTFFLLSIVLPIWFRFNYPSLFVALLFSLIAFYTKQYFIIGYLILIIYMFIFISIKKAGTLLATFLILFLASAIFINKLFECYFYNTLLTHLMVSSNDLRFAMHQLRIFIKTNLGLTLILLSSTFIIILTEVKFRTAGEYRYGVVKTIINYFQRIRHDLNWNRGLVNFTLSPYVFLFCSILLCLIFRLGGNTGAFMTYYYQLLSFPFIVVALMQPISYSKPLFFLFIFITFISSGNQYLFHNNFSLRDRSEWQKANALLATSNNIFSTSEIGPLLIQRGIVPYNSGFTEFFISSTLSPKIDKLFSFTDQIKNKDSTYNFTIRENIKKRKFDLLMLNSYYSNANDSMLSLSYKIHDSITLNFYHTQQKVKLYVWEPIPINN